MSRLHAQKRRVRALQRAEGIIAPDADQIDRKALAELGTAHDQIDAAEDSPLELEAAPPVAPKKKTRKKTSKR